MEAIKDLYNIYVNHYSNEDSEEMKTASQKLKEYLGDAYTSKMEILECELVYSACEQGFIEGFRYAAALLAGGKAVEKL